MRSSALTLAASVIFVSSALLQACSDDATCAETATCPPSGGADAADAKDASSDLAPKDSSSSDGLGFDTASDAVTDARPGTMVDASVDARWDGAPDASADTSLDARRDSDANGGTDIAPRDTVTDPAWDGSIDASMDRSRDVSTDALDGADASTADHTVDVFIPTDAVADADGGSGCSPSSCGNDKLCCQNACVAIDETHCYSCGAQCSGATPVCSSVLKGCSCTDDSCAPARQDCDTATGQCVVCKQRPADATDFYVDQTFAGSPTGSQGCPYRTITAALAAADASTAAQKAIHVAAGTYDAGAGEQFPLQLRSGISLVGSGAATTVIRGTGTFDHSQLGGYMNATYQVTVVIGDPLAVNAISDVSVQSGATPAADYFGIFCDRGNTPPDILNPVPSNFPPANATVARVTVGPGYWGNIAVTNTNSDGCNFKITGSNLVGTQAGIWGAADSINGNARTAALQVGDGTAEGSNSLTLGVDGVGMFIGDCISPLRIWRNTFTNSAAGLYLVGSSRPVVHVVDNTFSNLSRMGIHLEQSAVLETLTGNVFNAIGTEGAIAAIDTSQIKKARRNQIVGNELGVMINSSSSDSRVMDFGTAADPGLNIISCNSKSDPNRPNGQDFDVSFNGGFPGIVSMEGNAWDHVPPTRADLQDPAVNGTDIVLNPSAATTVNTAGATLAGACDYPHVPGP